MNNERSTFLLYSRLSKSSENAYSVLWLFWIQSEGLFCHQFEKAHWAIIKNKKPINPSSTAHHLVFHWKRTYPLHYFQYVQMIPRFRGKKLRIVSYPWAVRPTNRGRLFDNSIVFERAALIFIVCYLRVHGSVLLRWALNKY